MRTFILLIVAVFSTALVAPGQVEELSRGDYLVLLQAAEHHLNKGVAFRIKMTTEVKYSEDEEWGAYSYQTIEEIRPGRLRNVQHTGLRLETIRVNGSIYSKDPNTNWREHERTKDTPVKSNNVATFPSTGETRYEHSRLGSEWIDNQKVTVIGTTEYQKRSFQGEPVDFDVRRRMWLDVLGKYVKKEDVSFDPGQKRFVRHTYVYEYDPTITIEAPIK